MKNAAFAGTLNTLANIRPTHTIGRVSASDGNIILAEGLSRDAKLGDRARVVRQDGQCIAAEVLRLDQNVVTLLPDEATHQIALGDRVQLLGPTMITPSEIWLGRVIDPYGRAMDGAPLPEGATLISTRNDPPAAVFRKPLGHRLNTGFDVMNTLLPIVRGQRIGVFAEPGVGKTKLLADLMQEIEADVVVLALIGERGREIHDFKSRLRSSDLGKRTIIIAAAAHTAPTMRTACAQTAMRVAEFFRDKGLHVALFVDSMSRFADAHREASIAAGELPSLCGFPASTPLAITRLVERAGTGAAGHGDVTAVFSALLQAGAMEDMITSILKGVADGHVVLDKALAERGAFPAIDMSRSLSRALPMAASIQENALISDAKTLLSRYEEISALVSSGLYPAGSDKEADRAIRFHAEFNQFRLRSDSKSIDSSFAALALALKRSHASAVPNSTQK